MKSKFVIPVFSLFLLFGLTGCGGEKEEQKNSKSAKTASSSDIEVAQSQNPYEQKVAQKSDKDSASNSFYFDNSNITPEQAMVHEKPRTAIDANLNIRSPYEKIQISLLVKDLSKNFIVKCSACHNDYANGLIGPSLLGKSSEHIVSKIKKFKSDKTSNVLMSDLVLNMDDKEIKALADEIYTFNNEIKKIRNK